MTQSGHSRHLHNCGNVLSFLSTNDKAKPAERRRRKAAGPRFLREAMEDLPKDPKIAELPTGSLATDCY